MRIKALQFVTVLCLGVSSVGGAVAHRCQMEAFTPASIREEVLSSLPDLGISALPAARQVGILPGRQALLRNELLIGQLQSTVDPRHGRFDFAVMDGRDRTLLEVTETHFACPGGRAGGPCHRISLSTELEPEVETVPAYLIHAEGPLAGARARYYKYGREVGVSDFTDGIREALHWLSGTLNAMQSVVPLKALTPLDRARLLMASDPYVVGYLPSVSLYQRGQQLVIAGRVPSNFVYGRVIDLVRAAVFRYLRVDLIIDSRIAIPARPLVFGLGACRYP